MKYESVNQHVYIVRDFFSADECDHYIQKAQKVGFSSAPINTPFGPKIVSDVRNNTRVIIDDHQIAADLWARIDDFRPPNTRNWRACGINERFRFYHYHNGQQFDWHYDGYFERANGERSFWTFIVYLNDDFDGGQTTIENTDIQPEKGMALFFVHRLLHKGQPVTDGEKFVMRTDIMFRQDLDLDT